MTTANEIDPKNIPTDADMKWRDEVFGCFCKPNWDSTKIYFFYGDYEDFFYYGIFNITVTSRVLKDGRTKVTLKFRASFPIGDDSHYTIIAYSLDDMKKELKEKVDKVKRDLCELEDSLNF